MDGLQINTRSLPLLVGSTLTPSPHDLFGKKPEAKDLSDLINCRTLSANNKLEPR